MSIRIIRCTATAAVAMSAMAIHIDAPAQNTFPEGKGRDILIANCAQCHSIGKLPAANLDAEAWEFLVYDMIARGSTVHADEMEILQKYIRDNFAKEKAGD